jgi:hypothetical protein
VKSRSFSLLAASRALRAVLPSRIFGTMDETDDAPTVETAMCPVVTDT